MRNLFLCLMSTATLIPTYARAQDVVRPPRAATGVFVTGRALEVNGVSQIPCGLFGVHATDLDEKTAREWGVELVRLIHHNPPAKPTRAGSRADVPANVGEVMDCFWDRYQPARLLHDKGWKANMETLGRAYGEAAKANPAPSLVEFWNEPYLNWATSPAVNYDGAFYDQTDTSIGSKMTLKGEAQPTEFLVWDKPKLVAVDPERNTVDYLASRYIPEKIEGRAPVAGDVWKFRNTLSRRLELRAWGRDTTQKSHYSAAQNSLWYCQMFLPFARALKETNPNVQIIGGWGCHLQDGNWDAWHTLYKPLLDEAYPYLDGLNEHHYGQDTRMVAGAYETVAAYAKTTWNKDLKFYNTEAAARSIPNSQATSPSQNSTPITTPISTRR